MPWFALGRRATVDVLPFAASRGSCGASRSTSCTRTCSAPTSGARSSAARRGCRSWSRTSRRWDYEGQPAAQAARRAADRPARGRVRRRLDRRPRPHGGARGRAGATSCGWSSTRYVPRTGPRPPARLREELGLPGDAPLVGTAAIHAPAEGAARAARRVRPRARPRRPPRGGRRRRLPAPTSSAAPPSSASRRGRTSSACATTSTRSSRAVDVAAMSSDFEGTPLFALRVHGRAARRWWPPRSAGCPTCSRTAAARCSCRAATRTRWRRRSTACSARRSERRALADAAARRLERYEIDAVAARFAGLYRELLERSGERAAFTVVMAAHDTEDTVAVGRALGARADARRLRADRDRRRLAATAPPSACGRSSPTRACGCSSSAHAGAAGARGAGIAAGRRAADQPDRLRRPVDARLSRGDGRGARGRPGRVVRLHRRLVPRRRARAACGGVSAMGYQRPPEPPPATRRGPVRRRCCERNFIYNAVTVRRAAVDEAGPPDARLRSMIDWEWWLRLTAAGHRAVRVPGRLAVYRLRPASISRDRDARGRRPARPVAPGRRRVRPRPQLRAATRCQARTASTPSCRRSTARAPGWSARP